ncbi:tetratricopeptide repeat protein [Ramlibacter sp. USB13]|uniref:Tetratricopeptide repeat protein n=1 Tax=Ramlibacter cellulosilyticus TaxID=2764187 RepID=A0A923MPY5_9BURK|nr:tetratricopeptide repeat protein [Ramlibacter cellulosilyticus]MBC5782781.1 tetratricopeptide repeat protein [Ramlibacter cellulosilyticus]
MFGFGRKPAAPPAPGAADWRAKGNEALAQGRLPQAAECYRKAAEADPADAAARVNLGYVLLEQGDAQQAAGSLQDAARLAASTPDVLADAQFLLGRAWTALGEPERALASHRAALAARPRFADALQEMVRLLLARGDAAEALAAVQEAGAYDADPATLVLLAQALHATGRREEALAPLQAALQARPGDPGVLESLGTVLLELGRGGEALACFEQLLRAQGPSPETLANASAALLRLDRQEEALACAEEALRLDPVHRAALHNKGCALLDQLRMDEGLRHAVQAARQYPDDPDLRWNVAVAHLLTGDLVPGWEAHEARWQAKGFAASTHGFGAPASPRWTGVQDLADRSILLYAEQGLGDSIQFLRYLPLVAQRAREVLLQVQPALLPLLSALPANCRLLRPGEPFAAPDFQCPLLSLPHAFRTALADIPAAVPYLRADPARVAAWRERLAGTRAPRVGIAWSGNAQHGNDRNRSIALPEFRTVATERVQFVGVQPQVRETDRAALAQWPGLVDAGPQLHDFADTAALFCALDLVVTVDTSVAHLAGALGRPVWILLPYAPDWRWMLEREDSPWYPTARLFRQPGRGDWAPVLRRVRDELEVLAATAPA